MLNHPHYHAKLSATVSDLCSKLNELSESIETQGVIGRLTSNADKVKVLRILIDEASAVHECRRLTEDERAALDASLTRAELALK